MNELINQITQRVGISSNQATQTVQVVVDFLKQRLPPQISSQLDNFVSGGGQSAQGGGQGYGGMAGQGQQPGGMFGGDQPTNRP